MAVEESSVAQVAVVVAGAIKTAGDQRPVVELVPAVAAAVACKTMCWVDSGNQTLHHLPC